MAAFTAVNRVDDFAYIPQQNIGHAMTTFIAQNKGAGKKERIRRGFQSGIGIELVYGLILLVLMYFGAEKIMGLFTSQEDALYTCRILLIFLLIIPLLHYPFLYNIANKAF